MQIELKFRQGQALYQSEIEAKQGAADGEPRCLR